MKAKGGFEDRELDYSISFRGRLYKAQSVVNYESRSM